jgi:acetoin utilization deacetylase AcuC-like enzyme
LAHLMLTTEGYTAVVRRIKECSPRWVALGGGGYEVGVVPRAWTLAYGIMAEREFPDLLPPSYADKYGPGTLRDHNKPKIEAATKDVARRHATRAIQELRERIPILRR